MKSVIYLLLIIGCCNCTYNNETEIYQNKRDKVINVREKIREIDFKDVYISNISWPYLIDHYLLVRDYKAYDKLIHVFNKNDFSHITSIAQRGKGPDAYR